MRRIVKFTRGIGLSCYCIISMGEYTKNEQELNQTFRRLSWLNENVTNAFNKFINPELEKFNDYSSKHKSKSPDVDKCKYLIDLLLSDNPDKTHLNLALQRFEPKIAKILDALENFTTLKLNHEINTQFKIAIRNVNNVIRQTNWLIILIKSVKKNITNMKYKKNCEQLTEKSTDSTNYTNSISRQLTRLNKMIKDCELIRTKLMQIGSINKTPLNLHNRTAKSSQSLSSDVLPVSSPRKRTAKNKPTTSPDSIQNYFTSKPTVRSNQSSDVANPSITPNIIGNFSFESPHKSNVKPHKSNVKIVTPTKPSIANSLMPRRPNDPKPSSNSNTLRRPGRRLVEKPGGRTRSNKRSHDKSN